MQSEASENKVDNGSWESGDREGLVSIGSHSMFLSVSGPQRQLGQPLVVVEAGMGDGGLSWKAFQRLVVKAGLARVMLYDRSGLGRSEASPLSRTGENIAHELRQLLDTAQLPGPYVVVTHSYGGILARHFLAQNLDDVAGMVFVDAEQEDSYQTINVPWDILFTILGELDYFQLTGLESENQLLPDEWERVKADAERTKPISDAENAEQEDACNALRSKQQLQKRVLGNRPVAVIKANSLLDYQRIYDAGTAAGNGTEEQWKQARDCMDRLRTKEEPLQRAILDLSSNGLYARVDCGHNVMELRPAAIVDELKWVLENVKSS